MTPRRAVAQLNTTTPFDANWQQITGHLEQAWPTWVGMFFHALPQTQMATIAAAVGDGRQVRAHLLCLVNAALGGHIDDALPRALAIECIHAASLIHDDYVDQDSVRRQRHATWVVEGPRRAVLLGDIIFATAIQRMVELSRADGMVVAETIATMAHGAYRELLNHDERSALLECERPPAEIYDRIVYLKTGSLFAATAKLGAIASGAPTETWAHAFRFGALFGEAYQIVDDLDDIVALEDDWHAASSKLPPLLPLFFYFGGDEFRATWTLKEPHVDLRRWFQRESSTLKMRMTEEIERRTNLAVHELDYFPDNIHTTWLRDTPREILRKNFS